MLRVVLWILFISTQQHFIPDFKNPITSIQIDQLQLLNSKASSYDIESEVYGEFFFLLSKLAACSRVYTWDYFFLLCGVLVSNHIYWFGYVRLNCWRMITHVIANSINLALSVASSFSYGRSMTVSRILAFKLKHLN